MRLAVFAALLALAGCAYPVPEVGATRFTVVDPELSAVVSAAAAEWALNGLVIASRVTVSAEPGGVVVALRPGAALARLCESKRRDGCVTSDSEHFEGLWIRDGISAARLGVVVRHELIHVLVPAAQHLPPEVAGVMNPNGTTIEPTTADLDEICSHAECL